MSLHEQWRSLAEQERSEHDSQAFWDAYFAAETESYKKILANYKEPYAGKLSELAETFGMDEVTFLGFLDGINTSLKKELKLDKLMSASNVVLDVDFEKLYFNMHGAKADWLYDLPEWNEILTGERRAEIKREYRESKIYHKPETVGRNDSCPCGSGKKYKKCCGQA